MHRLISNCCFVQDNNFIKETKDNITDQNSSKSRLRFKNPPPLLTVRQIKREKIENNSKENKIVKKSRNASNLKTSQKSREKVSSIIFDKFSIYH